MKIYLVLFQGEIDIIDRSKLKVIEFILSNSFYINWLKEYNKVPDDLITEYKI